MFFIRSSDYHWQIAISVGARYGSTSHNAYASGSCTFYINGIAIGSTSTTTSTTHSDWTYNNASAEGDSSL